MGSEKRQRQRENRMRAIAEAERSKKRSTVGRKVLRVVLAVAAVLLALWLWSVFTGNDEVSETEAAGAETPSEALADAEAEADAATFETDEPGDDSAPDGSDAEAEADAAADDAAEQDAEPDDGAAADAAAPDQCPAEDGSDGPRNQFSAAPPLCIDPDTMYAAAFDTNMGSFTMVLNPALDQVSVNNFVVLGRWGAFDGTLFHRVIPNFVIQGGDVQLQYGSGGPGYQYTGGFPDADDWYRVGSVAMANRGNPATNGSQFFVITGSDGAGLPPLYSPMGHVVEGMDVVHEIEGVETDSGDAPTSEVVVRSVTISDATETQIEAYNEARS